jgi:calcineurin-like phosphoesterase family protein
MDESLIKNWNERITKNDTVYHLGDFAFGDVNKYLSRLNGNITILYGSHDKDKNWPRVLEVYPKGLVDEYGNKRLIVLSHYSFRSWPKSHYASYCLWGHAHGKLDSYGLSFDVGVDAWNYYPVSLEEVETKMRTLSPIVDFRNKEKGTSRV